jgi:hypothetical protein
MHLAKRVRAKIILAIDFLKIKKQFVCVQMETIVISAKDLDWKLPDGDFFSK